MIISFIYTFVHNQSIALGRPGVHGQLVARHVVVAPSNDPGVRLHPLIMEEHPVAVALQRNKSAIQPLVLVWQETFRVTHSCLNFI